MNMFKLFFIEIICLFLYTSCTFHSKNKDRNKYIKIEYGKADVLKNVIKVKLYNKSDKKLKILCSILDSPVLFLKVKKNGKWQWEKYFGIIGEKYIDIKRNDFMTFYIRIGVTNEKEGVRFKTQTRNKIINEFYWFNIKDK